MSEKDLSLKSIFGSEEKEKTIQVTQIHMLFNILISVPAKHIPVSSFIHGPKPVNALNDVKSSLKLQLSELHPRLSENQLWKKPRNLILIPLPGHFDIS